MWSNEQSNGWGGQRATPERDREVESSVLFELSIVCIFQNEAPYLKEWIEFHRMVGVQHFVLIDDRSEDDFLSVLQPYFDSGEVELFALPCPSVSTGRAWPQYQCAVYSTVLRAARGVTRWLALIDTDEFIVPSHTTNLVSFLEGYEQYGGVYLRWEPFGTSGVSRLRAHDLVTERLRMKWQFRRGEEMLGKSIVKPHRTRAANIHLCELAPGYSYWDSNPGMADENAVIKLHHYWSRDEQFLLNTKLPRAAKIKGWEVGQETKDYFLCLNNEVPDNSMERFIPELRTRLFGGI